MSIVGGLIMLCLVRRLLYHYYPGLIILSPTAMYQHRQRGAATPFSFLQQYAASSQCHGINSCDIIGAQAGCIRIQRIEVLTMQVRVPLQDLDKLGGTHRSLPSRAARWKRGMHQAISGHQLFS